MTRVAHESASRAMTLVVQELLSLGRSWVVAMRILKWGRCSPKYWLVFPFHACGDTSATVEDKGMQKLPQGEGSARLVSVKYPSAGGYTPGDTWDLYVGPDNREKQMVFRHGSNAKPSRVTVTWAGYKKAGPLLISTEHRGTADGKPFRLTSSDVAVKLTGSDAWVSAQ